MKYAGEKAAMNMAYGNLLGALDQPAGLALCCR